MARVQESARTFESYEALRLFRDEVEHIMKIMQSQGLAVRICDDTQEYASLDEVIAEHGYTPSKLQVYGTSADGLNEVTLYLSQGMWYLVGDTKDSAVSKRLNQFLLYSTSFWGRLMNPWIWGFASLILGGVANMVQQYPEVAPLYLTSLSLLIVLWMISMVHHRVYVGLTLRGRNEAFWRRNSDQLWMLVTGVVIGILLTLGLRILTGPEYGIPNPLDLFRPAP